MTVDKTAIINTNRSDMFTDSLQGSPHGRDFLNPPEFKVNHVLELDGTELRSLNSSASPRSCLRSASEAGSIASGDHAKVQFNDEVEEVNTMSGAVTSVRQLNSVASKQKSKFVKKKRTQ